MCRLLAVKSSRAFEVAPHLRALAHVARRSKEYQGHGWGCARFTARRQWSVYRNIMPIWEDDPAQFDDTTLLLAHARSAFRNEGITVENNMPFHDERYAFIFNGELHGVRIRERGRIGAEKVFQVIKRFDDGDLRAALAKAMQIIRKKTRYVRAMNIVMADHQQVCVGTLFNDDADYFTLHTRTTDCGVVVCSEPYPSQDGPWSAIENDSVRSF